MLEVYPLTISAIDWKTFLSITKLHLGRSVSKELDNNYINPNNLGNYISCLSEMIKPGLSPIQSHKFAGPLLDHGHFSVLVVCSKVLLIELIQQTRLETTSADTISVDISLVVLSGSLNKWLWAIINCSSPSVNFDIRSFANKCFSYFNNLGLLSIFSNYIKEDMSDNTFKLIEKR